MESVDPFLGFACHPNEQQLFDRGMDRQFLRHNDDSTAGGMRNERRKVCGHCLAIMCDEHPTGVGRQRQHLGVRYASQSSPLRRLKIHTGLTSERSLYDNMIEVRVGLKTYIHAWIIWNCRRAWMSLAWNGASAERVARRKASNSASACCK